MPDVYDFGDAWKLLCNVMAPERLLGTRAAIMGNSITGGLIGLQQKRRGHPLVAALPLYKDMFREICRPFKHKRPYFRPVLGPEPREAAESWAISRQRQTLTALLELASAGLMPVDRFEDLNLEGHGVGLPLLEFNSFGLPPPPPSFCARPWARATWAAILPSPSASFFMEVPTGRKVPVSLWPQCGHGHLPHCTAARAPQKKTALVEYWVLSHRR